MSKIELHWRHRSWPHRSETSGHLLMHREIKSVISRDRENHAGVWPQQPNHHLCHILGTLARTLCHKQFLRQPLHQHHNHPLVSWSDNQIQFSVTKTLTKVHHLWPFVNRHPVFDAALVSILLSNTPSVFKLVWKIVPQVSATLPVFMDKLIDARYTNAWPATLKHHGARALRRAMQVENNGRQFRPDIGSSHHSATAVPPSVRGKHLRILWRVVPMRIFIACNLAINS